MTDSTCASPGEFPPLEAGDIATALSGLCGIWDDSPLYDYYLAKAYAQGIPKGWAELCAGGAAKAFAEAYVEARAESILLVLEHRGIEVSEGERERVLGCTDVARLNAWLEQSLTVRTAAEIFGRDDV
ncbi:hypothetical protein AB0C21_02270 [Spirillospora sp. NPDC049024]